MNRKRVLQVGIGLLSAAALCIGLFLMPAQPLSAESSQLKVPGFDANQLPKGNVGPAAPRAHTVYLDGSGGKKRAAKHMTELHEVMASKGWTFSHLAPHIENADLEGWWITYVANTP